MVFQKVRDEFVDIMGFEPEEVQRQSLIFDELDADSLDISQILLALENFYGIDIKSETVSNMKTVGDLVLHIESLKG